MIYDLPIFIVGTQYRVKHDFRSGPTSVFSAGEILIFVCGTYSPYDDCFVYTFHSERSGESKDWWLPDGEPKEDWRAHFDELGFFSEPTSSIT
jgi:hypothetical protein